MSEEYRPDLMEKNKEDDERERELVRNLYLSRIRNIKVDKKIVKLIEKIGEEK